MKKYGDDCEKVGLVYYPLICETYGGWTEESQNLFQKVISKAAKREETEPRSYKQQFYQPLSIILQRQNAKMVLARDNSL
jgi:hypothetical protein